MGRVTTPEYRVEYRSNLLAMGIVAADGRSVVDGRPVHIQAWRGRANRKNLEAWRQAMNKSFLPGGSNEHISRAFNAVEHITMARIVRQRDHACPAEVHAPMFEVVS